MDTPPQLKNTLTQQQSNDQSPLDEASAGALRSTYNHGQRLSQDDYIQLAEISLSDIDPDYPKLLLTISSIVAMLIITALTAFLLITKPFPLMIVTSIIILMIFLAAIIIKLIHLKANKITYGLFKNEMVLREGLFWVSTTALPYTRLQHVNLSQGPAERKFNLVTLKCFSAGSGLAEINLPGLNADLAEHLRQHLLNQAASSKLLPTREPDIIDSAASNVEVDNLSIQHPQQDSHNG